MKRSNHSQGALLLVFVALGLLVLLSRGGGGAPEGSPRLATRLGGPDGGRALFQASLRLGLDATGDVNPPLEWERPANANAVRALLGPTRELAAAEARAVLDWVKSGGDLVLSLDEVDSLVTGARLRSQLRTALEEEEPKDESWDRGVTLVELGAGRILNLGEPRELTSARLLGLAKPEHPYTDWVRERLPKEEWLADLSGSPVDPQRGVALVQHFVRFVDGRPVLFDDSAHGLGARIDPARRLRAFLWSEPMGHALLALLVLLPLGLLVRGARRGPPLPPSAWGDTGRSSLEHARALASLWADAGATERPRELLASDLGQRLGAGRDPNAVAQRLARLAAGTGPTRAAAQNLSEALGSEERLDPRQLTELARARKHFLGLARNLS